MFASRGVSFIGIDRDLKANEFLKKIKPVIRTGDINISPKDKNTLFMQEYKLKNADAISMIAQLEAEDCYSIEPNNNPRYADAEVYKFRRSYTLECYGVFETVLVYIKMYLAETKTYDYVVVISFHKDGDIED